MTVVRVTERGDFGARERNWKKSIRYLDLFVHLGTGRKRGRDNQSICGASILRRGLIVRTEMGRAAFARSRPRYPRRPGHLRPGRPVPRLRRVDERVVKRSYGWLAYARAPAVCLNY